MRAFLQRVAADIRSGASLSESSIVAVFVFATATTTVGQIGLFDDARTFAYGILSALLATSASGLVLLAARAWWQRRQGPLPVVAALIAFATLGMARQGLLGVLHDAFELPSLFRLPMRIWVGLLQGLTWLILASTFSADRERFLEARASVLDEQAQIEERELRQSVLSNALARELADTVGQRVTASVAQTRALLHGVQDFADSRDSMLRIARALRSSIDEEIRPLSRELWAEAPSEQLRLSLPMTLRLGGYARPYPVVAIALVGFVFAASMAVSMPNPMFALLLLAVQVLAVALVLIVSDRWIRSQGERRATGFWMGVLLSTVAAAVVPYALPVPDWTPRQVQYWAIACALETVLLVVFMSLALGLAGSRNSVLLRARASLSSAEVTQRVRARELAEASRKLARHLHSSLQGRLMAIALELERAAEQRDLAVAADATRRLEALLETPLVQALEHPTIELERALQSLVSEWSVIADVRLRIDIPAGTSIGRPDLVVGIAEEAIANAIRHAHASHVEIGVTASDDDVLVSVRNDGSVSRTRSAGLGSRWLDSVSPDNWRLQPLPDEAGMVLDVRLTHALAKEPSA